MSDLRFYRAQERAVAGSIVKEWPKVWRMPRKVPHGRLVAVTVEEVIAELRENGYQVIEPARQPAVELATPTDAVRGSTE